MGWEVTQNGCPGTPHERGNSWCPCSHCRKHRLAYALLVARNHGDITSTDYDAGMLILDVYLSGEEL